MVGTWGCNIGDLRVQWRGFGGAMVAVRGAVVVLWVLAAPRELGGCPPPHHLHQDTEVPVSPQNTLSLPAGLR